MNSKLYGKHFVIPDDIRNHLVTMYQTHGNAGQGGDGFERNRQFQNAKSLSYQQAKRIKNFFDTYKGDQNSPEYHLNGGTIGVSYDVVRWLNGLGIYLGHYQWNAGIHSPSA